MSNSTQPTRTVPAEQVNAATPPQAPSTSPQPTTTAPPAVPTSRIPHTRTGATWFGICVAALLFVVLIIFMMQNTRSVQVHFLGMHGSLPLALALLIAAVGAAIVTMVVGAARITQLRRLSRTRR
jgi:uncharacterized integral membrane protein